MRIFHAHLLSTVKKGVLLSLLLIIIVVLTVLRKSISHILVVDKTLAWRESRPDVSQLGVFIA